MGAFHTGQFAPAAVDLLRLCQLRPRRERERKDRQKSTKSMFATQFVGQIDVRTKNGIFGKKTI